MIEKAALLAQHYPCIKNSTIKVPNLEKNDENLDESNLARLHVNLSLSPYLVLHSKQIIFSSDRKP